MIINVTEKQNRKNSIDIFEEDDYWDVFLYIETQDKFGLKGKVILDIRLISYNK